MEMGRLRMSVGHGGNKRGRPMSPIEVAVALTSMKVEDGSAESVGEAVGLSESNVGRFLKLLGLPVKIQHQIDWGSGGAFIGFSAAVALSRLTNHRDQSVLANEILASSLTSKEVPQIIQLRKRSGKSIEDCVKEIKGMRTIVEKRFVLIGAVSEELKSNKRFLDLSSSQRNELLRRALELSDLISVHGRLGRDFFTLVGARELMEDTKKLGPERMERFIRAGLLEELSRVTKS